MLLKLYRFITRYFSFLVRLYLNYRLFKGKEDSERFYERLGYASADRKEGFLIWFHAASVGESVSVVPLISEISKKFPHINILMTTGTLTSSKLMASRLPNNVIHQFIPVDTYDSVHRFLSHWQPNLAIWVESELWPNLIIETKKSNCELLLINGRMSDESFRKWKNNLEFAEKIISNFSLCLVQTEDDKFKYNDIGSPKTIIAGNLKYEAPTLPSNPEALGNLILQIGNRNIWLCASTHIGEEEIIIEAHKKLQEVYPDILTIIMPRHPKRARDIEKLISNSNLKFATRSKNQKIKPETDIYLADTIGEVGVFYRVANIVFMGGSLITHGGQNPLEAARLGCAIISGKNYFNFQEVYTEMKIKKAVILVKDSEAIFQNVKNLIADYNLQKQAANLAFEYVESKKGILANYLNHIEGFIRNE
ncbi:MAG: 3-deoxy-D-manno-octulosonic acid transferase [Rickettsiales bacterium]|nr:3-deoxy-D-manno-octulosonic acid transferase [Rickettsiales bacterium]